MKVDAAIAIALGIKESKLGTGAIIPTNRDRNGVPLTWKLPDVNPLQLSAACKTCKPRAKSGMENQGFNIRGALQVFKDVGNSIRTFGGEGQAASQLNYSKDVQKYFGAITDKTAPIKTVCLTGCR